MRSDWVVCAMWLVFGAATVTSVLVEEDASYMMALAFPFLLTLANKS